jgi:dTDP-4-amino-4,6-dideoxygalactose transaminase
MSVPFVDLGAQQRALARELNAVASDMLGRTDWVLGHDLEAFEREFADYCGAAHAVGVDSGLSALELILRGYGIGPGDEVITAANTFIATALAISHAGARPVLVDVDPHTYNLDPELVEAVVTARTRAIMPVHLYGQPADMESLGEIADRHGLLVIEDAAQAHGARHRGRRAGSLGHAAGFSFYPAKNLGALGDGGAVVTDDGDLAEAVRVLRDYGQRQKYDHAVQGFNRRLDTLQAGFLRVKLRHLDEWSEQRRRHAALYEELLGDSGVVTPVIAEGVESVWHLYVVRSDGRDALRAALGEQGIQTGIHYPVPVHLQTAYSELGHRRGDFPVTERYADEILSLPMYPELEPDAIRRVAAAVDGCLVH